jgi:hypothetical protein
MGDLFLEATDPAFVRRRVALFAALGGACLLADAACAATLLLSLHGWQLRSVRWGEALRDFHGDAADVALLAAARVALLPLVAAAGASRAARRVWWVCLD